MDGRSYAGTPRHDSELERTPYEIQKIPDKLTALTSELKAITKAVESLSPAAVRAFRMIKLRSFATLAAAFLMAYAAHSSEALAADLTGRASVIDGDTIQIHDTRIRFYGIDAPESRQLCNDVSGLDCRCGQKAVLAMADHIGVSTVSCDARDIDRYGRTVAVCHLGVEEINAWLVSQGLAVAYRHYSKDYVLQEEAAHAAGLGVWAGAFMAPWDWRAAERSKTTSSNVYTSIPEPVSCCKVCSAGKACGDSCISRTKQCHKGPGFCV